jgi:hypothetical protein
MTRIDEERAYWLARAAEMQRREPSKPVAKPPVAPSIEQFVDGLHDELKARVRKADARHFVDGLRRQDT